MISSTLSLFNSLPVYGDNKLQVWSRSLLMHTLPKGFIFDSSIVGNYHEKDLVSITKQINLTHEQLNASFHKSWEKVQNASLLQLIVEQYIHYITTYGFEALGIYDENTVFIPHEKLDIPDIGELPLFVVKGYTEDELKEKVLNLLNGTALSTDTLDKCIIILKKCGVSIEEICSIQNREAKVMLFDCFQMIPSDPFEFLRYLLYKVTGETLIIKNMKTVLAIKEGDAAETERLFNLYNRHFGLIPLSRIFNRYKPLFLAFKKNAPSGMVNTISRLSKTNHVPLRTNLLDDITRKLKHNEFISFVDLSRELSKVNIFRKIRLLNALQFRTESPTSILYKIRNGKGFATDFSFEKTSKLLGYVNFVAAHIASGIAKNVEDKKIYIPENVIYSLPSTEKQFIGNIPAGSSIHIPNNMIFGVHWDNDESYRVDLDLSLMDISGVKFGWDGYYRDESRSVLFSGDVTSPDRKIGASEYFLLKHNSPATFLVSLNFYNYTPEVLPKFDIIVGHTSDYTLDHNYLLHPRNIKMMSISVMSTQQKSIGIVSVDDVGATYYFNEFDFGSTWSASMNTAWEHVINYTVTWCKSLFSLNLILEEAGAIITRNPKDEVDIDLNPKTLEKDTILNLLS